MYTSEQTFGIVQLPAHLEPSVELFQFFTRDFNGDTYLSELPYAWLDLVVKGSAIFVAWEVRKHIGDRWVVIAQSENWVGLSVSDLMMRKTHGGVINDLWVCGDGDSIWIYFCKFPNVGAPCIRIHNHHSISIVGGATLENYDGFLKAAQMAKHLLK